MAPHGSEPLSYWLDHGFLHESTQSYNVAQKGDLRLMELALLHIANDILV